MNIIFGNFGNPTIAVMQWAHENQLSDISVVSVDTGWGAENWDSRIEASHQLAKRLNIRFVRLQSKTTFADLMIDRKQFPSTKFQWCASFLKGLAFLDWLDDNDPDQTATIIMGKRRLDSPANFDLPEYIEESEHFGERKVWYPLFNHCNEKLHILLQNSKMEILPMRSLECDPCVNSYGKDLARLQEKDIMKTEALEKKLDKTLFTISIRDMVKEARQSNKKTKPIFDMGCGSPFACGE